MPELAAHPQASLVLPAATAAFGQQLIEITTKCMFHLLNATTAWAEAHGKEPMASTNPLFSLYNMTFGGKHMAAALLEIQRVRRKTQCGMQPPPPATSTSEEEEDEYEDGEEDSTQEYSHNQDEDEDEYLDDPDEQEVQKAKAKAAAIARAAAKAKAAAAKIKAAEARDKPTAKGTDVASAAHKEAASKQAQHAQEQQHLPPGPSQQSQEQAPSRSQAAAVHQACSGQDSSQAGGPHGTDSERQEGSQQCGSGSTTSGTGHSSGSAEAGSGQAQETGPPRSPTARALRAKILAGIARLEAEAAAKAAGQQASDGQNQAAAAHQARARQEAAQAAVPGARADPAGPDPPPVLVRTPVPEVDADTAQAESLTEAADSPSVYEAKQAAMTAAAAEEQAQAEAAPEPQHSGAGEDAAGPLPVASSKAEQADAPAPAPAAKVPPPETWEQPHTTGACAHVPVVYGELVLADPPLACHGPLANARDVRGLVVVVLRGECSFAAKAAVVHAAGAAAMVVVNFVGEGGLVSMTGDANDKLMPMALLDRHGGDLVLREMLRAAREGADPPVATLSLPPPWPPVSSSTSSRCSKDGGHGSGAGGAPSSDSAEKSDGSGRPAGSSTRVDMLIPVNSHAFLAANVLSKGKDLQTMFEGLLEDSRAMLLLMQVCHGVM